MRTIARKSGAVPRRRLRIATAMLVLLAGSHSAVAGSPYAEVLSFGDSLSDVGTYRVGEIARLGGGRFTTNPGPVWVERVAAQLGTQVTPFRVGYAGQSVILGGTGFAEGGARVTQQPGTDCNPNAAGVCTAELTRPISQQIDDYLVYRGRFDDRQLVFVQGGANDLFVHLDAFQQVVLGEGGPVAIAWALADATAAVSKAALDLARQVQRIHQHGGRSIVVLNLPDVRLTPFGRAQTSETQLLLGGIVQLFNGTLAMALIGSPAVLLDSYAESRRIAANPSAFGIGNATEPACDPAKVAQLTGGQIVDAWALVCTDKTLVALDAAQTHFYADDQHPTTLGHEISARFVIESLRKRGIL